LQPKTDIIIAQGDAFFYRRTIPQMKLDTPKFLAIHWHWILYYKRFTKRIWNIWKKLLNVCIC